MSDDVPAIADNEDFGNAVFRNMLEQFITPEVVKRQSEGTLPHPLHLEKGQVIFRLDSSKPEIRINSEVKAIMKVALNKPVAMGDEVYTSDITDIQGIVLQDDEQDLGHYTFVKINGSFFVSFDFLYNKSTARELLALAEEYLEAARLCLDGNLIRPYVDNLFNACELAARARLAPDGELTKSHGSTHSKINRHGKLGNVDGEYVQLFNTLSQLRSHVRYSGKNMEIKLPDHAVDIVRTQIADLWWRYDQDRRKKELPLPSKP